MSMMTLDNCDIRGVYNSVLGYNVRDIYCDLEEYDFI
jgi:hypothetical protein